MKTKTAIIMITLITTAIISPGAHRCHNCHKTPSHYLLHLQAVGQSQQQP